MSNNINTTHVKNTPNCKKQQTEKYNKCGFCINGTVWYQIENIIAEIPFLVFIFSIWSVSISGINFWNGNTKPLSLVFFSYIHLNASNASSSRPY